MSETTREDLERTIQQAREDIATWPEWMREAARLGAALPPNVLSVADEMDRLRAENERLRAEVAAERERCAVTAEECSCECCCTPEEIAMAEYIAGKIRKPNAVSTSDDAINRVD